MGLLMFVVEIVRNSLSKLLNVFRNQLMAIGCLWDILLRQRLMRTKQANDEKKRVLQRRNTLYKTEYLFTILISFHF